MPLDFVPRFPRELCRLPRHFRVKELGEIVWAHRVNTEGLLQKVAVDNHIHFVEGDVWLQDNQVVMSHNRPWEGRRYLLFQEWLHILGKKGKGIKIDLKDTRALTPLLRVMREEFSPFYFPLIFNADVFLGPKGKTSPPPPTLSPEKFIRPIRSFSSSAILSLGFTTVPFSSPYSSLMIGKALSFAVLSPPATIALRVELVTEEIVQRIVSRGVSLTLWSDQDCPLGEKWWRENGERIKRYSPFALMDFPDAPRWYNWENDSAF